MAAFAFDQASLKPGCPLWVVAQPAASQLTRKIDWYLNFQIMKAECHKRQTVSVELAQIEEEWGFDRPEISVTEQAPMLIPSHACFPNTQTVIVPFAGDGKRWAETIQKISVALKMSKIRVFLPDALSRDAFKKAWPKKSAAAGEKIEEIELVERKAVL